MGKSISGNILAVISAVIVFSCQIDNYIPGDQSDIAEYDWGTKDKIWIDDGYFHSFKKIDTLKNELAGDTLTPLIFFNKNKLIISQLKPTRMELQEDDGLTSFIIKKATFVSDTFTYDVKKYIDKTFLILFSRRAASKIYALKSENENLKETNNIKQPIFEVEGYHVGQPVSREKINITYTDNFGNSVIEEATLKSNPNVQFTLVGTKYIEQIQKFNIPDNKIDALKNSINNVFSVEAEYEEISNGEGLLRENTEAWYWNEKEVSISLKKIVTTYKEQEQENENNSWTLQYENYLITYILQNYLEKSQENI